MYEYRKMTFDQRVRVVLNRRSERNPSHDPPHRDQRGGLYFITAACYEHVPFMDKPSRRVEWELALKEAFTSDDEVSFHAWVILPNHYHLVLEGDLSIIRKHIGRLHNGKATQWNREDQTPGRKVWFRFSDRLIRGERHYYASLNYIHENPVKHRYIDRADHWPTSSLNMYLSELGPETLAAWNKEYPTEDYGRGWDER